MIRQGKLCRSCTSKQCKDLGTDREPIEIECPLCDGDGCDECEEGYLKIPDCPNRFCKELIPAVNMIELFEKGLPPIAGGVLDQSAWFIECVRTFQSEEASVKADDAIS